MRQKPRAKWMAARRPSRRAWGRLPMPDMPGRRALRRRWREVDVDAKGSPTGGYSGTARVHLYCVTLISSKLNLINHVPFASQRDRICRRQFLLRKAPLSAPCGPSTTFALASQNAPSQDLRARERQFQDPSFVASINGGQARNLPAVRHVALPQARTTLRAHFGHVRGVPEVSGA